MRALSGGRLPAPERRPGALARVKTKTHSGEFLVRPGAVAGDGEPRCAVTGRAMPRDPLNAVHAPFQVAPELSARLPVDRHVLVPMACDLVAGIGDRSHRVRVPLRGHTQHKESRCGVEAVEQVEHRRDLAIERPPTPRPVGIPHAPPDDLVPVLYVERQQRGLPRAVRHRASVSPCASR